MKNNTYLNVVGIDTCRLDFEDNMMIPKIVMFVPSTRCNHENGLEVYFYNNIVSIGKGKKLYAMGKYELDHELFKLRRKFLIMDKNKSDCD